MEEKALKWGNVGWWIVLQSKKIGEYYWVTKYCLSYSTRETIENHEITKTFHCKERLEKCEEFIWSYSILKW